MTEKNHSDQAMLSLQEELNQMAGEVPEMPDSFRLGWREAVRKAAAEASEAPRAAAARRSDVPEKEPVPFASAVSGKKAKPAARNRGIVLSPAWSRSLSIAALFVLLLGGALLGQDAVHFVQTPKPEPLSARKAEGSVSATSALSPLSTPVVLNSAPDLALQESGAGGSIAAGVSSLPDSALLTPEAAGFQADSLPKNADAAAFALQSEAMESNAFAAEEAALSAESVASEAEEAVEEAFAAETAEAESEEAPAEAAVQEAEASVADAAAPEAEAAAAEAEAGSVRQETPFLRIAGICLIVLALLLILPVLWFRKRK